MTTQFKLWFRTPGTPTVSYNYDCNQGKGQFKLTLSQRLSHAAVGGKESDNGPLLHIPVAVGLLDKKLEKGVVPTIALNLKEKTKTFIFDNLKGDVIPSLLRDFSAPVYLEASSHTIESLEQEDDRLAFLKLMIQMDFVNGKRSKNCFADLKTKKATIVTVHHP